MAQLAAGLAWRDQGSGKEQPAEDRGRYEHAEFGGQDQTLRSVVGKESGSALESARIALATRVAARGFSHRVPLLYQ